MTRKSSATASATPPPMQKPSMAPIVICSMSCQARVSRGPSFRCRRSAPRSMVLRERPSGSLRSKPAVKASLPPVSTTTDVDASSSKLRAALVNWRIASGDSALMPSPRSNRTIAMRPSGPWPLSMVTYSANATSLLAFLVVLQMARALVLGLGSLDREADRGADGEPARAFAGDVMPEDHIQREDFARPVAHAGLKARLHRAGGVGRSGLAERFDGPLQGIGELPVEADAVEREVLVAGAIPQPAAVEINAHRLRQTVGRRDHRRHGASFAGDGIKGARGIKGDAKLADAGRHEVHLGFRREGGAPLAVGFGGVGEQAQLHRLQLEGIDNAGRVGNGGEIGVGRRRKPALDLARAGLADVGGIDSIGIVGRPRLISEPRKRRCHHQNCESLPLPHGEMLPESPPRHSPLFAPILASCPGTTTTTTITTTITTIPSCRRRSCASARWSRS